MIFLGGGGHPKVEKRYQFCFTRAKNVGTLELETAGMWSLHRSPPSPSHWPLSSFYPLSGTVGRAVHSSPAHGPHRPCSRHAEGWWHAAGSTPSSRTESLDLRCLPTPTLNSPFTGLPSGLKFHCWRFWGCKNFYLQGTSFKIQMFLER